MILKCDKNARRSVPQDIFHMETNGEDTIGKT